MKLHVPVSALVAISSAGVSLAQSDSTSTSVTFSDISDRLGPFVNGPTNVNEGNAAKPGIKATARK